MAKSCYIYTVEKFGIRLFLSFLKKSLILSLLFYQKYSKQKEQIYHEIWLQFNFFNCIYLKM